MEQEKTISCPKGVAYTEAWSWEKTQLVKGPKQNRGAVNQESCHESLTYLIRSCLVFILPFVFWYIWGMVLSLLEFQEGQLGKYPKIFN